MLHLSAAQLTATVGATEECGPCFSSGVGRWEKIPQLQQQGDSCCCCCCWQRRNAAPPDGASDATPAETSEKSCSVYLGSSQGVSRKDEKLSHWIKRHQTSPHDSTRCLEFSCTGQRFPSLTLESYQPVVKCSHLFQQGVHEHPYVYSVDGEVSLAAEVGEDLWADCIFPSEEEEGCGGFSWWNRCFWLDSGGTLVKMPRGGGQWRTVSLVALDFPECNVWQVLHLLYFYFCLHFPPPIDVFYAPQLESNWCQAARGSQ